MTISFKSPGADAVQYESLVQQGHFLLSSGMHSPFYIQAALLLQYPDQAAGACKELADRFRHMGVEVVAGPAIGGILVAYEVARQLGARALWAERVDGRMALRRSFSVQPGERALVVEDVVTTGSSASEVKRVLEEAGARVVGVGVLVDRSGTRMDFDVPFEALMTAEVEAFIPSMCPLCLEGVPLTKPGSRVQVGNIPRGAW